MRTIEVKRTLADGTIKLYRYPAMCRNDLKILSLEQIMAREVRVLPRTAGIYFLLCAGVVIYVGQSANILVRLGQHISAGVNFDDYRFIECGATHRNVHEFRYIKQFAPALNDDCRSRIRRRRMQNGKTLVKENTASNYATISTS